MTKGCNTKLAPGQWWNFCGETDMGQTLPALCTHCGGEYIRADDPEWASKVEVLNKLQATRSEILGEKHKRDAWVVQNNGWKITPYMGDGDPNRAQLEEAHNNATTGTGHAPSFIIIKKSPTDAERLAKRLRERINPFELGLTDDQQKKLGEMIIKASEHAAPYLRQDLQRYTIEELLK